MAPVPPQRRLTLVSKIMTQSKTGDEFGVYFFSFYTILVHFLSRHPKLLPWGGIPEAGIPEVGNRWEFPFEKWRFLGIPIQGGFESLQGWFCDVT